MMKMSEYQGRYAGKPAAVLGGGPSLPEDLKKVPKGSVLIAVNYHALRLVDAEFMVFNDDPLGDPRLFAAAKDFGGVRVNPDKNFSDVEFDVPVWTGFFSSNTAAWFALWMGCDPVILCGMDCYQGDRVYFHEYSHDTPAFHYPLDHYLDPWKEDGQHLLPHKERLKVMSGPLVQIFGQYESTVRSRERTLV